MRATKVNQVEKMAKWAARDRRMQDSFQRGLSRHKQWIFEVGIHCQDILSGAQEGRINGWPTTEN